MEEIPDSLIHEVLQRLDLESLCSTACVSKTLNLFVSKLLSTRSSLDLSGFSPDPETLKHILYRFKNVKTVSIDCLRLKSSEVFGSILEPSLQELTLMKGAKLSCPTMCLIGRSCPNLRYIFLLLLNNVMNCNDQVVMEVSPYTNATLISHCVRILSLEFIGNQAPTSFENAFTMMLKGLEHLESLSVKLRGAEYDAFGREYGHLSFPSTLKALKLQTVLERVATQLLHPFQRFSSSMSSLHQLSLVLDVMTDDLIICITNTCPLLVELNLEDKPHQEPISPYDLTNNGFRSLSPLQHLKTLSIIRSRANHPASFKRINDMGMFLFSRTCEGLESLSLGGFSNVTDAGFSAIMNSCQSLRKFQARNVPMLSDLSFHKTSSNVVDSFVELRLLSCSLVTSEVIEQLTSCASLETLDVSGCRSVSDSFISFLSCFGKLSTLNLGGTDVSDNGLAVLGNRCYPLARLCLRGCKRVTDKGISGLLEGGGTVSKTLTSLDLGCIPGISDDGIGTIASSAPEITELCIRHCYSVTDASVRALASKNGFLRTLDLFNCHRLSIEMVKFFEKPWFCKLKWLGVGLITSCANRRDAFGTVLGERPWLTVCFDGCESGCHDGWHFSHSYAL